MSKFLAIIILIAGMTHILWAQPFDTLLSQFNSIHEIYPLQDSTFILIGTDKEILVERINQKAEVIWSLPVTSLSRIYFDDFRYDITSEDSVIQISTADKFCDAYGRSFYTTFTINFSGKLLDSQIVSFGNDQNLIFLLSGLPNRPRLAYLDNKKIILMQANGDTTHLQLIANDADTVFSEIFGKPKVVTMCPDGDLLVGSTGLYVSRFRLENNHYVLVDRNFSSDFYSLFCPDDQFYLAINENSIVAWENHFPTFSFYEENQFIRRTTWRDSILAVHVSGFYSSDTLYFLQKNLDLLYKESIDNPEISTMAIQDKTIYRVGSGNIYDDHGLLQSEHQSTHEGPKYYDIEIVDFQPGPYDAAHFLFWDYYLYEIPHATVTLTNHCDYTINAITIWHGGSTGYCSDTSWERELTDMNLQPGETKSFDIYDIFIMRSYPLSRFSRDCVYALRPDNHFDDQFEDNQFCKKLELIPSAAADEEFPIHHRPSIITDDITFLSPEAIEFDLTIFSFSGIPVLTTHTNTSSGHRLDLKFLPAGLYLFQYYIPDRDIRYVEKILKY